MAKTSPQNAARRRRRSNLVAYGFMSPWFIGFLCFSAFPIVYMLSMSLTNRKLTGLSKFLGFKNYVNMVASPTFLNSLKVTLFFTIVMMIVTAVWALFMAMLLNRKQRLNGIFQFFYFVPAVIPTVALAFAFRMILGADAGVFNYLLTLLKRQKREHQLALRHEHRLLCGVLRDAVHLQHRANDDDLPLRPERRSGGALRGPARSTAPARCASSSASRCRLSRR